MTDFGLDLHEAEDQLDGEVAGEVVLGVLDGETDPATWVRQIEYGNVLVLAVDGDLNDRAAGFAGDVVEMGGELTHFRGFLIVSPPNVTINADRLGD